MPDRQPSTRLVVLPIVAALLLAGCGGNGTDASTASTKASSKAPPPTQPTLPKNSKGTTSATSGHVPLPPPPSNDFNPNAAAGPDAAKPSAAAIDVVTPKVLDVIVGSARFSGTVQRRYSDALRVVFFAGQKHLLGADLPTTCPAGTSVKARCTFDTRIDFAPHIPPGGYTVDVGYSKAHDDTRLAPVIPLPLTVHAS